MTTTYPPFAPTLDLERQNQADRLPHREAKRTGHLFADCAAYLEQEPLTKAVKPKACTDCQARRQVVSDTARRHQQAYDAAWYAAQVAADLDIKESTVSYAQQAEAEIWEAVARQDRSIPQVDVYEAVIDTPPPAARDHRPNKFAGSCVHCGAWVEAGAGALGKNAVGKWVVAHLGSCPQAKPVAASPASVLDRASEPGAYVRIADGAMIRVAVSRTSGKPYALLSSQSEDEDDEYLGGGRHLDGLRKATYEEAVAYGRAVVRCCVCGTHLENPASREAGIGPICASKGF